MLKVRGAAGIKTIDAVRLRKVADANPPKEILAIRIRTPDGLKTVWRKPGVLSAICESSPYGAVASGTAVGVQTSSAEVIVSGGFPPYTPAWTRTDANPETWNAVYPDRLITPFIAASVDPDDLQSSTWECEVTDSRGNTATTNEITVNAQNFGTGL